MYNIYPVTFSFQDTQHRQMAQAIKWSYHSSLVIAIGIPSDLHTFSRQRAVRRKAFSRTCFNTQNYWVFGLCPSSGILETRKHNVSRTGYVSVLRWEGEDPYSVGSRRVIEVSYNRLTIYRLTQLQLWNIQFALLKSQHVSTIFPVIIRWYKCLSRALLNCKMLLPLI
jgi:hypothetical protein